MRIWRNPILLQNYNKKLKPPSKIPKSAHRINVFQSECVHSKKISNSLFVFSIHSFLRRMVSLTAALTSSSAGR